MKCGSEHRFDPERNFCCKCRYWRENGTPFSLPTHFKAANSGGYTQREIGREIIESAKAEGREIERKK